MIKSAIVFLVSNFTLTLFVVGLLSSVAAILRSGSPPRGAVIGEKLLSWYVFWVIGVTYFCNFVFHCFFGAMAAAFIGWADSPFQFEVGTASLGFAVAGFIAAWRSFEARLVAVIGPSLFVLGAAAGHVREMVETRNFAPGNAGVIFYTDILLPLVGFALLWLARRHEPASPVFPVRGETGNAGARIQHR